jgi:hypothetical protein
VPREVSPQLAVGRLPARPRRRAVTGGGAHVAVRRRVGHRWQAGGGEEARQEFARVQRLEEVTRVAAVRGEMHAVAAAATNAVAATAAAAAAAATAAATAAAAAADAAVVGEKAHVRQGKGLAHGYRSRHHSSSSRRRRPRQRHRNIISAVVVRQRRVQLPPVDHAVLRALGRRRGRTRERCRRRVRVVVVALVSVRRPRRRVKMGR